MVIKLGFQNLFAEVLVYRTSSLSGIQIIKTKIRSWSHLRQAEHGFLDILIMVDTRAEGIIFLAQVLRLQQLLEDLLQLPDPRHIYNIHGLLRMDFLQEIMTISLLHEPAEDDISQGPFASRLLYLSDGPNEVHATAKLVPELTLQCFVKHLGALDGFEQ